MLKKSRGNLSKWLIVKLSNWITPNLNQLENYPILNHKMDEKINHHLSEIRNDIEENGKIFFKEISFEHVLNYFNHSWQRWNCLISIVSKSKAKKILNIGCAYGFYDLILKQKYGKDMIGADLSRSIRDYSGYALNSGLDIVAWNVINEKPPFSDEEFDSVICAEVLEHIKYPPGQFFKKIKNLLKVDGELILSTPNINRQSNIIRMINGSNILEKFPEEIEEGEDVTNYIEHVREYTIGELIDILESSGFNILKVVMCSRDNFIKGNKVRNSLVNDIITIHAQKVV